jgi:monovalent cation:H+ antiporter-2, CPA2 family
LPHILLEILILAGAATLITTISHYGKLPTIIGFVLTGIIIGPHGFRLVSNLPDAYSLTELASVILMFTIGLEFSLSKLRELKRQFLKLGATQVAGTIIIIMAIGLLFTDYPPKKVLLWSFMISLSSTALVLKLLHDYRDLNAPHGQNAVGILLFQDIIVIPMMLIMPLLAGDGSGVGMVSLNETMIWLLKVLGVSVFLYLSYKFGLMLIMERVVATRSHELFFFSIIFICLGVGYLFHSIGLSLSIGAFVAGALISESAFGHQTMAIFGALRDTFLGLFFAAIGMLLDIGFVAQNLLTVFGLGVGFFAIKSLVIIGVCLFNRTSLAVAIITALSITQVGEFSFLIVSEGVGLSILDNVDNQFFLAISVLSMVFTPFLYLLAPKLAQSRSFSHWQALSLNRENATLTQAIATADEKPIEKSDSHEYPHTIIIGFGIAGRNVVEALKSLEMPYRVIEANYEIVKESKLKGFDISFGDASREQVLKHAQLLRAKMVVIAISDSKSIPHIIRGIRVVRPDISIVVRTQYIRDIKDLKLDPRVSLVVAEIETATELVANVLRNYGVDSKQIYDYTLKARSQLSMHAEISSGDRYRVLNLPSWDTLASIRPFLIDGNDFANGKRIDHLALPQKTGGSIVSIFRAGIGTKIPKREFIIKEKDVVHIIASPEAFYAVESLLKTGFSK